MDNIVVRPHLDGQYVIVALIIGRTIMYDGSVVYIATIVLYPYLSCAVVDQVGRNEIDVTLSHP